MDTRIHSTSIPRRARGYTLIELAVVAAIVGGLVAPALPSFFKHVQKSRRTGARSALLDLASRQERYFSINNVYATTPAALGYTGTAFPIDVAVGSTAYYQLSTTGDPSAAFSATAVPTGNQASDSCGTYTVNQFGVRGNTGNTTASSACW